VEEEALWVAGMSGGWSTADQATVFETSGEQQIANQPLGVMSVRLLQGPKQPVHK
jgi:hypothetical protein